MLKTNSYYFGKSFNLKDIIKGSQNLGKVTGIDVSSIRTKTQNIIMVMARRIYDAIKAFTPFDMNSATDRMMKE
jgi:hypothetical protein